MLIRGDHLREIVAGSITLAFRRWKRPTVKAGGTLRTVAGVLAIEAVDAVRESQITAAQARQAGYASRSALLADLNRRREGQLYRVKLRLAGADPRVKLRKQRTLSRDDVQLVRERLERFDAASRRGPWTQKALRLIARHPGKRAADLARSAGFETAWFKGNVRKLKELGLTESLEIGYRLSPRGRAYLSATRR